MDKSEKEVLIPTNDFFARYLFANVGSERILLHFLNALRKDANEVPFKSIELLDTFNLKENILERETVVDVKARTETDELVMVEVQNVANAGFVSRLLYYIAVNYAKQVNVSLEDFEKKKTTKIDYMSLKPIISVSILNFDLHLQTKRAHSVFRMKECTTGFELTKDWELHLIELKKVLSDESRDLALWIRFFTSKNPEEDKMTIVKENPFFEEVYEKYKNFSGDVELMEKYRDIQAYYITQQHMLNIERQEGLKQGIEQGIEQGLEQGLEQGAREKTLEVAKNFLSQGLSVEQVSKGTGLTEEEIKSINN